MVVLCALFCLLDFFSFKIWWNASPRRNALTPFAFYGHWKPFTSSQTSHFIAEVVSCKLRYLPEKIVQRGSGVRNDSMFENAVFLWYAVSIYSFSNLFHLKTLTPVLHGRIQKFLKVSVFRGAFSLSIIRFFGLWVVCDYWYSSFWLFQPVLCTSTLFYLFLFLKLLFLTQIDIDAFVCSSSSCRILSTVDGLTLKNLEVASKFR